MAFFTTAELSAFLQQEVDSATAALATEGACDVVQAYCRQSFESVTDTLVLPVDDGGYQVSLPMGPVTAVSSVVDFDGEELIQGKDEAYYWDGISPWIIFNVAQDDSVTVTYTHGRPSAPATVKAVALSVAARAYTNPNGLRTEFIADLQATYFGDGSPFGLFPGEKRALDRYAVKFGTVKQS